MLRSNFFKGHIFIICFLIAGCVTEDDTFRPEKVGEVQGLRPIYDSESALKMIQVEPPRKLTNPGKIYVKGQFLYINELRKGIHVINNIDPRSPEPIAFINIPGNVDMAVKQNVLYVDNHRDLVAIELSNGDEIKILKRIKDALPANDLFPPQRNIYFECVDESKGVVIGWEEAILNNPKCYR
ncbi:hypothetical protein QQ008_05195 [Fulvivirgaceae bacterium BMA10]|uniref:LVIVD repeat-containing protein n=1 Tax=Splendidivirga corallicola TaxID=3051826 RepID=A0ABT8KJ44_9BACT|nr:hypothetical protein [Fulvivirgaceae bacterium BMA10]